MALDLMLFNWALSSNSKLIRLRCESMVLACSTTNMVSKPYEIRNRTTSTGSRVRFGFTTSSSPARFHKMAPRSLPLGHAGTGMECSLRANKGDRLTRSIEKTYRSFRDRQRDLEMQLAAHNW